MKTLFILPRLLFSSQRMRSAILKCLEVGCSTGYSILIKKEITTA